MAVTHCPQPQALLPPCRARPPAPDATHSHFHPHPHPHPPARRFSIRLARHITRRQKILVFNWCYHGTVDETFITLG